MEPVEEKVVSLLEKLEAAPNARKANKLYERLQGLLVLYPERGVRELFLQCVAVIEDLSSQMKCVELAVPALTRKYGSDVKVAFAVNFTPEDLQYGGPRAAWRQAQTAICAKPWVSRLQAILMNDLGCVELHPDTLTPMGDFKTRGECQIAYRIDGTRFRDLQVSLESRPVQKLSLQGDVRKVGSKLMLVDQPCEIIGPHEECRSGVRCFSELNYNIAECNNLSCEKIDAVCGLCPCKEVRYCSADCQRQHWPIHKQFCKFVVS